MADGCGFFKQFRGKIVVADQSGAVLPFVAAVLLAVIGFGTLAMDIPRFTDLQTQLQSAADAFALAGAADLDGSPAVGGTGDAISRANKAINTLMASRNSSFSAKAAAAVTVQSITFYSKLPATDNLAMANGTVTADPAAARFVEVKVTPVTISTFFPATLLGAASNAMSTNAAAVAGFTEVVCQFTPLFICNPFEGQNPGIYDPANIGKEFVLKQGPQTTGTAYSAGNYGFLSVNGNGANPLNEALAATNPGACFAQNGVATEPGNIASASDWVNVRFDLYSASASKLKTDAGAPPAPNVRKGCLFTGGNSCGENPTSDLPATTDYCNGYKTDNQTPPLQNPAQGLPHDSPFPPPASVGNGFWDLGQYWLTNHNSGTNPWGCTAGIPCNAVSRYAVYKREIDNNNTDTSPGWKAPGWTDPKHPPGETGAPSCAKVPAGDQTRRQKYRRAGEGLREILFHLSGRRRPDDLRRVRRDPAAE
jgi:hypothetical protein